MVRTELTAWLLMIGSAILGAMTTVLFTGCQPSVALAVAPDVATQVSSPASSQSSPEVTEFVLPEVIMTEGKEWPQWGGTRVRNNVPNVKNLPESWNIGKFDRRTGDWDGSKAENIRWFAELGSQTYGNPVVAGGRVFVGTNNGGGYLKRYPNQTDLGCLLAFDQSNGDFLWQHSSEKLITGRVHDWPLQGICCAPLVEGERLWFVTSRGEVRCLDTEGFYDGEDDGAVQGEVARVGDLMDGADGDAFEESLASLNKGELSDALRKILTDAGSEAGSDVKVATVTENKVWNATGTFGGVERTLSIKQIGPRISIFKSLGVHDKQDADVIWVFNMMDELGVSQHNMCACSVTSYGDLLFVNTSNGLDESHINLPAPDAPSFICMDKNTGEVLWTDGSPGSNILHGQWSSPSIEVLGGVPQVMFCGGDGILYSFKASRGQDGKPELLWQFDCNPKTSKWVLGGEGTRNNLIATPVAYEGRVYIAVGQDPEHGEGEGHLWCIDPTKRGDVSPQLAVKMEDKSRTPIKHKRTQAVEPELGEAAVDNPNSAVLWHYSLADQNDDGEIDFEEEMHRSCGTVAIKDDVLYIADFSGLLHCLDANGTPDGQAVVHFTYDMFAQSWGSPLISDGKVYIGDEDGDVCVFEFGPENNEPIEEINMGSSVYSTPVAADETIFISTKDKLFAIGLPK
ncbi:Outer membrane protein assembly factor BamB, contains PQQ-like beta-propeller repeat [Neorhodopirellula lusitana]|uniref:Outer membrane protein assembly factor BamB, contains PQQ-like beta-propeller repeat n=1 Tax=Neorhodopirellula lusitana TaxID=445327 RepID=A0ABY1Q064_9BACT|nr:PQQ-binding-like beta-propeller repeat protein [Neorhodopirellula lusitana]SMP51734.1 Outer membrane protein assembly factor BamB, contains PQQ-like beta-propeller repeat [Neorhodopirellula lusitana]